MKTNTIMIMETNTILIVTTNPKCNQADYEDKYNFDCDDKS